MILFCTLYIYQCKTYNVSTENVTQQNRWPNIVSKFIKLIRAIIEATPIKSLPQPDGDKPLQNISNLDYFILEIFKFYNIGVQRSRNLNRSCDKDTISLTIDQRRLTVFISYAASLRTVHISGGHEVDIPELEHAGHQLEDVHHLILTQSKILQSFLN